MDGSTATPNDFYDELMAAIPEIVSTEPVTEEGYAYLKDFEKVKGYDFNQGLDYEKLFDSYKNSGIQATSVGRGIEIINEMIKWRLSDEPIKEDEDEKLKDIEVRKNTRCTIFLGYSSNIMSSGMREILKYLCQHKMVDCIVTTAGGIEEDFIKCMSDFYVADFHIKGAELHEMYVNRTGNMLVSNECYINFQRFFIPIIKECHDEQKEKGTFFTPSMLINRMGKAINNEDSVYYWCWKNDIPVFCPGFTDGALGDNLYLYNFKEKGFIVDVSADI